MNGAGKLDSFQDSVRPQNYLRPQGGAYGKIIINNREVAEILLCNIKVVINRENFCMSGSNVIQTRIKNTQGVGNFKIMKVWDRFIEEKLSLKMGIDAPFSMRFIQDDPNSNRLKERTEFILPKCYFTGENPIANWTFNNFASETYDFVFDDSKIIPIHKISNPLEQKEGKIYSEINSNKEEKAKAQRKSFPSY